MASIFSVKGEASCMGGGGGIEGGLGGGTFGIYNC